MHVYTDTLWSRIICLCWLNWSQWLLSSYLQSVLLWRFAQISVKSNLHVRAFVGLPMIPLLSFPLTLKHTPPPTSTCIFSHTSTYIMWPLLLDGAIFFPLKFKMLYVSGHQMDSLPVLIKFICAILYPSEDLPISSALYWHASQMGCRAV